MKYQTFHRAMHAGCFDVVLMGNHGSVCVGFEPAWEVMAIAKKSSPFRIGSNVI